MPGMILSIDHVFETKIARKPLDIKLPGPIRFDGHLVFDAHKACDGSDGVGHILVFRDNAVGLQQFRNRWQELSDRGAHADDRMLESNLNRK